MKIEDSVVVVTGGMSGLGRAVVEELLKENPRKVCLMDAVVKEGDSGDEVVSKCERFCVDVTDYNSIRSAAKAIMGKYSKIDAVVHCAGITHCPTPMVQMDDSGKIMENNGDIPEIWERVIHVNVMGTLNIVHCLSTFLAMNHGNSHGYEKGVFVLVSSSTARDGSAQNQGYVASKGAINSITLPLARELGPLGIRVVTIGPGVFETPMSKHSMSENVSSALLKSIPLGRFGVPREFAETVVNVGLKSEYISGEVVYLDGAWRSPFMPNDNVKGLSIQKSSGNEE
ncbi:putative scully-like protein [Cryptosporidium canis]|uniref:Scully-like protein n=1 Tax=Cryptosporidium canis TaxID=195482 RepID=A0A9D5DIY5_9CRYT|nr:putative scully-like protein [Cryptosporidium canis]